MSCQSGLLRGLDLSISNIFVCLSDNAGKSFKTSRAGGGGGGLGGGGGGIAALDELFDNVGAPLI